MKRLSDCVHRRRRLGNRQEGHGHLLPLPKAHRVPEVASAKSKPEHLLFKKPYMYSFFPILVPVILHLLPTQPQLVILHLPLHPKTLIPENTSPWAPCPLASGWLQLMGASGRTERMGVSPLSTLLHCQPQLWEWLHPSTSSYQAAPPRLPWTLEAQGWKSFLLSLANSSHGYLDVLTGPPEPCPRFCKEYFHWLLFRSPTWGYVCSQDSDWYIPYIPYGNLPLLPVQSCWVFIKRILMAWCILMGKMRLQIKYHKTWWYNSIFYLWKSHLPTFIPLSECTAFSGTIYLRATSVQNSLN